MHVITRLLFNYHQSPLLSTLHLDSVFNFAFIKFPLKEDFNFRRKLYLKTFFVTLILSNFINE